MPFCTFSLSMKRENQSLIHRIWGGNGFVYEEGMDFSVLLSKAHFLI